MSGHTPEKWRTVKLSEVLAHPRRSLLPRDYIETTDPTDPRRMYDGRNAWRKMTPAQRRTFLDWIDAEALPVASAIQQTARKG